MLAGLDHGRGGVSRASMVRSMLRLSLRICSCVLGYALDWTGLDWIWKKHKLAAMLELIDRWSIVACFDRSILKMDWGAASCRRYFSFSVEGEAGRDEHGSRQPCGRARASAVMGTCVRKEEDA